MLTQQRDFIGFEAKCTIGLALLLGDSTGNKGNGRRNRQNGEFPFTVFSISLANCEKTIVVFLWFLI